MTICAVGVDTLDADSTIEIVMLWISTGKAVASECLIISAEDTDRKTLSKFEVESRRTGSADCTGAIGEGISSDTEFALAEDWVIGETGHSWFRDWFGNAFLEDGVVI